MKRIFSRFFGLSAVLTLGMLILVFSGANISYAITNTTAFDNTPPGGLRLKQNSNTQAVLRVQFGSTDVTKTLTSVKVTFAAANSTTPTWANAATSSELADLVAAANGLSGVQLWKGATAGALRFQGSGIDTQVALAATPVYVSNAFTITPASAPTLATDDVYFVVLKTKSSGVTNNNAFTVAIGTGDITLSSASPTITAVTTATIVIDTAAPTLSSSGPANASTNVSISAFIGMNFNKNLDPTTLTPTNITMTNVTDGNAAVPVGIRPFPVGFNVVVSNPPTYAASSNFAKLSGTSTATYQIGASGTSIFPQPPNGYVAPTVGDIVLFQHDTFPADLGIVTNNTLTNGAGTFAVNGFNLFGGQQITKKFSATATGAVSASTTVNVGDLIVINTTANPTTDRYQWHIVTTGVSSAALNGGTLRVDDQASAPTFAASSSFSTVAPASTDTANASNQLAGGLAFGAGDLVFANVSANADNTGAYAWHLVTTAQTVSAGAAPTTLRFDSNASAPTFVNGSRVSRITTVANGAVTDTTTTLNSGDIVFAKTTANASNNGAYAFHLVSNGNNGSGGAASTALRFDNATTPLLTGKNYTVSAGVGVTDQAGNALASPVSISFTTGTNSGTNTAPPFIISNTPQAGNQSFPLGAPLSVQFSVPMATTGGGSVTSASNIGLFLNNFGAPGASVAATNAYNSTSNMVTITPSAPLTANTDYILKVFGSTASATGTFVSPFLLSFHTGSAADTTAPTVLGIFPAKLASDPGSGAGTTPLSTPSVSIGFSKDLNPATVNASTITINNSAAGVVSYNPSSRTANFSFTSPLAANTLYTVTVVGGSSGCTTCVKDLSGNPLALAGYTSTFRTNSTTDNAAPSVTFGGADNFGVSVTFSKAMKTGGGPNAVDNIANYTLESPIGSSISLAGKTVIYDGPTMTAKISGLTLQFGGTFKVTVSNLAQDIAGNLISTSGSPANNTASGTVANATSTGGNLGPGGGGFQMPTGTQNYTPTTIMPMSRLAGASTGYMAQFPVATNVPLGGSIVLTFPMGFDVTNAVASTAGTESFNNSDINGPLAGTVTIASVTANATARTVTVVTGGADTGANAFLRFDLKGIANTTVPSSTGYTVDIKTKDASGVILETKTSAPFNIGAAGSNTLTVNVWNDNGAGGGVAGDGIKNGTEPGLGSVVVFLFSPAIGGTQATTNGSGVATFSSLSSGDYGIGINPASLTSSSVVFNTAPQQITISGNTTKNYALGAAPYTISGTITGTNGDKVDVWGSSQSGFIKKTMILTGGADAYSLPVSGNTTYNVGVGPAIPDSFQQAGSTLPPPPTFSFVPPPSLQVIVTTANVTGKNFALTAANRSITGTVTDSAGNGLNGVQLFARPAGNTTTGGSTIGMGTSAQTSSTGAFTLKVTDGTYIVEAFKPGFPSIPGKQISVAAVNTPATLAFQFNAGSTLTISGTIKDDSGNAVAYAGVGGRKVVSTATNAGTVGGDASNFVGGPADANGAYTLYVSAGTWAIDAFAPGFGKLGSKTVTVGSTSLTGQDFSAATLNMGTITGTASQASVLTQGVVVRAEGSSGANMGVTDSTGTYSLKVPAGSYTVTCMFPGVGEGAPLTSVVVTASTTTSGKNCSVGASAALITLTVNLTDGTNPISGAFVDARDSNGRGNNTSVSTTSGANAVYTLTLAPGTYTVRAGSQTFGQVGTTTNVSTTRTITYTASAGATHNITGTVTGSGTNLAGAWVSVRGTPTGNTIPINIGAQTASNGTFTIAVPSGSYKIRADKPSYTSPAETTVTVALVDVAVGTIALTTAARTISGTVTLSGVGVSSAFVDASNPAGGFAVTQTDTTGAFSLPVNNGTWVIRAHSLGYQGGPVTVVVSGSDLTGQTITLSAISGFTVSAEKQETITPTQAGIFTNSDIGSNFKVSMPANALGSTSNSATFKTKANTNVPTPQSGTLLSKNAVSISALDSGGTPITDLGGNSATVVVPYDASALPTGAVEANLVLATWNTATNQYDTVPTVVDTTAKTLTATVTHFSDYAPLVPSGGTPPATPTGLAVSVQPNSGTVLNVSWMSVSDATSYNIYRSTDNSTFTLDGSSTTASYGSTGLTTNTTYYYKVSAVSGGGESATTSAVSAVPIVISSSVGAGALTSPSVTTPVSITTPVSSGGGGSSSPAPATTTTISTTTSTTIAGCNGTTGFSTVTGQSCAGNTATVTTTPVVIPGCNGTVGFSTATGQSCVTNSTPATMTTTATPAVAPSVGGVGSAITKAVTAKNTKLEVKNLQTVLNQTLGLKLKVSGALDKPTIAALKAFQKKNGLKVDGVMGPATLKKINKLLK